MVHKKLPLFGFNRFSIILFLLSVSYYDTLGQCVSQLNPGNQLNRQWTVTGDFNKDNYIDLVTVNNSNNNISFFKGNGNWDIAITPVPAPVDIDLGTSSNTSFVRTADLNNDTYLDLIVVFTGDPTNNGGLKVVLNNKTANPFSVVTDYSLGVNIQPTWVTTGDFNNDSFTDLAVTNRGNNTLSILIGNATGTFSTSGANFISVTTDYSSLSRPWGIVSADFNKDNKLDLAVSMSGGSRVLLFFGDGTGNFGAAQTPSATPTIIPLGGGSTPRAITTADLNGDTYLDLAVANNGSANLSVLLYSSSLSTFNTSTNYPVGNLPTGITSGDFNGDGIIDLATSNFGDFNISILNGLSSGTFSTTPFNINCNFGAQPQSIATADLDGDNILDLFTSNNASVAGNRGLSLFFTQLTPVVTINKSNCFIALAVTRQGSGDQYSLNGGAYQASNSYLNITSGTYSISVKNIHGCIKTKTGIVVTPLAPAPTLTSDNVIVDQPTCSVRTATITINTTDAPSLSASYQYSINNGADYQSAKVFTDQPPGPYQFTAKIINSEGCTSSSNVSYVKDFKPDLVLNVKDESICDNGYSHIGLSDGNLVNNLAFTWTSDLTNVTIAQSQGTASLINDVLALTNTGANGSITYTIVASSGADVACKSTMIKTIGVGSVPTLGVQNTNAEICGDSGTANVLLTNSNNVDGAYYELTSTASTNLSVTSNFSTNLIADQFTLIDTTIPGTLTYAIKAVAGICKSPSITTVININPVPKIISASYSNALCSGANTDIVLTSNQVLGAKIDWSISSTPDITGAANGNDVILNSNGNTLIAQALNVTSAPQTITYSITPKFIANSFTCQGSTNDVTITVNPAPSISVVNNSNAICSGASTDISITNTNQVSGSKIDWTISPSSFPDASAGNDVDLNSDTSPLVISQTLTNSGNSISSIIYTITSKFVNGDLTCFGAATPPIAVSVNPVPSITVTSGTNTICSGSITNISITNNQATGVLVDWTTDSDLSLNGSNVGFNNNGNLTIAQPLTNAGNAPTNIIYTITPKFTNSGLTCSGQAAPPVVITVNPVPSVAIVNSTNTICSGSSTSISITNTNQMAGTLLDWTISSNSLSGAFAGNNVVFNNDGGLVVSQPLVNSGSSSSSVTYTFTPKYSNNWVTCYGTTSQPQIISVNPVPVIEVASSAGTICSGSPTNISISNTNRVSGASVDWAISPSPFPGASTASNIGFSNDGSPLIIAQTLTNSGNSISSLTYTITTKFTNNNITCQGDNKSVTISVNTLPAQLVFNSTFSSCSDAPLTMAPVNSHFTYSWSRAFFSDNITGFKDPESGNEFSETLSLNDLPGTPNVKEDTLSGTVVYSVSSVSNATGCASQPAYAIATIVPKPSFTINNSAPVLCSGDRTNITFDARFRSSQLLLSSVIYSNGVDGGGIQAGKSRFVDGQLLNQLLRNLNSNNEEKVTYTFIPLYGTCAGETVMTEVTVKPVPNGTLAANFDVVCNGASQKISYVPSNSGTSAYLKKLNLNGLTRSSPMFNEGDVLISNKEYVELLNNTNTTDLVAEYTIGQKNGVCEGDPLVKEVRVLGKDTKLNVSFTETNLCNGDLTIFKPSIELQGTGNINYVKWDFGDNSSEMPPVNNATRVIKHKYNGNDIYNVSLNVRTTSECSGSFVKRINVSPLIEVSKEGFTDGFSTENGWMTQSFNEVTNSYQLADQDNTSWVRTVPNGTTIKDSNEVWWTGNKYTANKNTYGANEKSAIYSPCFKIDTSVVKRPMLALDAIVDLQTNVDGVVLQYSTNGNDWTNAGNVGGGINWFNGSGITSNPGNQEVGNYGWTGNSNPKWKSSRFNLYQILNDKKRNILQFRFAFSSDATNPPPVLGSTFDGFAFDNFFIGDKSRTVLVEQFVNDNNKESTMLRNTINQLFDDQVNLATDFNPLEYHIGISGTNDVLDSLNMANPDDPAARSAFFRLTEPPKIVINGIVQSNTSYTHTQMSIDTASLSDSKFDLQLSDTRVTSSTQLSTQLTITNKNDYIGPVLAYIALVDNRIKDGKGNAKDPYRKVVRKQILESDGQLISYTDWVNGKRTISKSNVEFYVPFNTIDPLNHSLVAFVQDKNTKEVYQSISVPLTDEIRFTKIITGLEQDVTVDNISIFPNPTQGQFSVSCPLQGLKNWTIINQLGMEVVSGVFQQPVNERNTINITGIAAGVYYFKLATEGGKSFVKKLVLLNN